MKAYQDYDNVSDGAPLKVNYYPVYRSVGWSTDWNRARQRRARRICDRLLNNPKYRAIAFIVDRQSEGAIQCS